MSTVNRPEVVTLQAVTGVRAAVVAWYRENGLVADEFGVSERSIEVNGTIHTDRWVWFCDTEVPVDKVDEYDYIIEV